MRCSRYYTGYADALRGRTTTKSKQPIKSPSETSEINPLLLARQKAEVEPVYKDMLRARNRTRMLEAFMGNPRY
jgi:hypothetical protein